MIANNDRSGVVIVGGTITTITSSDILLVIVRVSAVSSPIVYTNTNSAPVPGLGTRNRFP